MKLLWLLLAVSVLYACDDSKFSGRQASGVTRSAQDAEPQVAPTEKIEADDSDYRECLLATGGEAQSVVSISQGNFDTSKITPNSILVLEVQGQAQIDLSAVQISSLKGICIFAAGGANIQVDLSTTVLAMYYYSRGNSTAKLNFGGSGSLAKLTTDVSGASQLQLNGENLACSTLKLPAGGSSRTTCNGSDL